MSLEYIRNAYGVPAKRGQRVHYTGNQNAPSRYGTITGASGAHLKIRMDGDRLSQPYHPTWELEYLEESQHG